MATARNRSHKHFQLDSVKIKRGQKMLCSISWTETGRSVVHGTWAEDQLGFVW